MMDAFNNCSELSSMETGTQTQVFWTLQNSDTKKSEDSRAPLSHDAYLACSFLDFFFFLRFSAHPFSFWIWTTLWYLNLKRIWANLPSRTHVRSDNITYFSFRIFWSNFAHVPRTTWSCSAGFFLCWMSFYCSCSCLSLLTWSLHKSYSGTTTNLLASTSTAITIILQTHCTYCTSVPAPRQFKLRP